MHKILDNMLTDELKFQEEEKKEVMTWIHADFKRDLW